MNRHPNLIKEGRNGVSAGFPTLLCLKSLQIEVEKILFHIR